MNRAECVKDHPETTAAATKGVAEMLVVALSPPSAKLSSRFANV